jgi:hypothetical protein
MDMRVRRTPYADTALSKYLDYKIDSIKGIKTEEDIAAEMRVCDASQVRRFRTGEDAVPLDWIGRLAFVINAVPINLYRLALDQHWPTLQETFAETLGAIATPSEAYVFLREWRAVTENRDPARSPEVRKAISRMFEEVKILLAKRR